MQATQSRTASGAVGESNQIAAVCCANYGKDSEAEGGAGGVAEGPGLVHDARNLLGALSLYSELLGAPGVLSEEHREFASELKLLSDRSWAIIDRLVNHARIERKVPTSDVRTVLPNVVEGCRGILSKVAGRTLEVWYGAGAYKPVNVREEAVERILTNLVKNASESMSGEGKLWVKVDGMEQRVVMTVRDSGCGMSSATVRGLMQAGGISPAGGRGLGFRIVRELVAISGGCLSVESEPGVGTSISVEWQSEDVGDGISARMAT
jgi:signal transduction histidine kinase